MKTIIGSLLVSALFIASCGNKTSWKTYESKDGKYIIDFPGEAKDTSQLEGMSLTYKKYFTDMNAEDNSYYSVMYLDIPPIMDTTKLIDPCKWAEGTFKYDVILYARAIGGFVKNDSVMRKMDSRTVREFKIDFADSSGTVTMRKLCGGSKIYTLLVVSQMQRQDNENTKHFFDSFKLQK